MAAVNPCGFPLLPAYLEFFVEQSPRRSVVARTGRAISAGAFATLGFVVLFGAFGLAVEAGWSSLTDHAVGAARYAMVAAGVVMVVVGITWVLNRPIRLRVPVLRPGLGLRRPAALGAFGASYGVASIGCSLPLFVSGVATALAQSDPARGVAALVSYALGMGTVLSTLALAVAVIGPAAGRPLRPFSRVVPVLGGGILVAVGLYVTATWLADIVAPTAILPVEGLVTGAQHSISSLISAHTWAVAALLGSVLVGAIMAPALIVPGRSSARRSDPSSSPVHRAGQEGAASCPPSEPAGAEGRDRQLLPAESGVPLPSGGSR